MYAIPPVLNFKENPTFLFYFGLKNQSKIVLNTVKNFFL